MKYATLVKKTVDDLQVDLRELTEKKLKLELQGRDRNTANCSRFKSYRRDIARIKTLLRQKEKEQS
ncbi:MAG: 50S ribosomal protein L29 [Chromatiales bacterium]|nr:50S ribosomal protein L29 [Chromatiales bacterium]